MGDIKIAVISDIHIDVLDPEYQWDNLVEYFFEPIEKDKFDIVIVTGDITDRKIPMNSKAASVFNMFIDRLMKLDASIMIVEGTRSHDEGQINAFSHRITDKFRIYTKVSIDVVKGAKMLLIPEEYMHSPEEYYKEYLDCDENTYDFVFGHGMFDHEAYTGKGTNTFNRLTSPMWNYEKHFKKITKHVLGFGHVHQNSNLGKFWSIGSFGRYTHGQEEPKGYMTFEVIDGEVYPKFHENLGAKKFITINESTLPDSTEELLDALKVEYDNSYKLRVAVTRDITQNRKSDLYSFCKNHVGCTILNKFNKHKKTELVQVNTKVSENKYKGMDMVDATIEFALDKFNVKLTRNGIHEVMNG